MARKEAPIKAWQIDWANCSVRVYATSKFSAKRIARRKYLILPGSVLTITEIPEGREDALKAEVGSNNS